MLLLEAQIKLPRFLAARPRLSKKNMSILYTMIVSMTMKDYTIPIPRWTNMD